MNGETLTRHQSIENLAFNMKKGQSENDIGRIIIPVY